MTNSNNRNYKIATIPGDGIGKEVVPEGIRVVEAAARAVRILRFLEKFRLELRDLSQNRPHDAGGRPRAASPFDAIFLGAVGYPGVPDHVSLWGLLIPIRRGFHQYVNLRPVRLLPGMQADGEEFRAGPDRFLRGARKQRRRIFRNRRPPLQRHRRTNSRFRKPFSRAADATASCATPSSWRKTRKQHVTSATKSNGIIYTMPFWDERFAAIAKEYPDIRTDQFHIDILTAHFVRHPGLVRRGRRLESFRRYSFRPRARGGGLDRHRRFRESESRARIPVHVRAGARLGAGHCRQRHRQSDRADLVGRDDAAPFWRNGSRGRRRARHRNGSWRAAGRARRTLAEKQIRKELGEAIASAIR